MSPDNSAVPGADGGVPAWEQVMRAMLGDGADEAIRELQERGFDPGAMAAASGLPDDPAALQQVFAQVQALLAASGDDPVNWQMAHDLARQQAAAGGDPSLTAHQSKQVLDALAVAELWLDDGERIEHLLRLLGRERRVTACGGLLAGQVVGHLPVDRVVAGRGEQGLDLREHLLESGGVVGQPGCSGHRAGVEPALLQLTDRFVGAVSEHRAHHLLPGGHAAIGSRDGGVVGAHVDLLRR